MIQANELRIGNWVMVDKPIEVNSITGDGMNMTEGVYSGNISIDYDLSLINPIPLTPGILEKAGFVKMKSFYILKGRGNQTSFSISWDGAILNVFDPGFEMSHGVLLLSGQSKYLHQLQNLYFALTGTELEINLNP